MARKMATRNTGKPKTRMFVGGLAMAGIGAAVNIGTSIFTNKQRKDEEERIAKEQAEFERKRTAMADSAEFSQFANAGKGYNVNGIYADGGKIKGLASDTGVVQGPSHAQGGVDLDTNTEVEGGETLRTKGDETQVFSKNMGFSKLANSLAIQKGILEHKLLEYTNKLDSQSGTLAQTADKYKSAGVNRKVDAYTGLSKILQENITTIDKQLDEVFNTQQSVNGDHSNEDATRTMGKPRTMERPVNDMNVMAVGGKIKGKDGMSYYDWEDPTNQNKLSYLESLEGLVDSINPNNTKSKISPVLATSTPDITSDVAATASKSNFLSDNAGMIGDGITTLGNVASNLINLNAFKKTKVPKPQMAKAYTQEARVDTTGQEMAIDDSTRRIEKYVEKNVANPTVARQIMTDVNIKSGVSKAGIRSQKENAESQIRGRNLANIQGIDNINIGKQEQHAAEEYNKRVAEIEGAAKITAGATSDIRGIATNEQMRNYQGKQMMLQAMQSEDEIFQNDIAPFLRGNTLNLKDLEKQLREQGIDEEAIQHRVTRAKGVASIGRIKIT